MTKTIHSVCNDESFEVANDVLPDQTFTKIYQDTPH